MKTTTKSLTYFRFISWLSIMFAFINIGISPIKAQRYSPRQIINVGTVVNSAIGGLVGGVFKAVGEQEGRRINFQGANSLKDRKAQEEYNAAFDALDSR
jgi:hypothetical protein